MYMIVKIVGNYMGVGRRVRPLILIYGGFYLFWCCGGSYNTIIHNTMAVA